MSSSFLHTTAAYIKEHFEHNIQDILVLVPNKRTGLFLEKELGKMFTTVSLLPVIQTIEQFIESKSDHILADPLELKAILYKVFHHHLPMYESFDHFYHWGDLMLSDFNDIDKNLVNADDLFQLLLDEKEIDKQFQYLLPEQIEVIKKFWSTFKTPDGKGNQQDFIDTWKILGPVYHEFRQILQSMGKAYSGMMFREVSEKISRAEIDLPYERVFFTGFHILSKSEDKICGFYQKNRKGIYFWDTDLYYLSHEKSTVKTHEAGTFLRPLTKHYYPANEPWDMAGKGGPEIHLVACPRNQGQAMAAKELIGRMNIPYNEKTALILSDENMLIPVLQEVSQPGENINVTLGYSLENSAVTGMMEAWMDIGKFKSKKGLYHKPVLRFINNPYIRKTAGDETEKLQELIHKENLIYIPPALLSNFPVLQNLLVRSSENPSEILQVFGNIISSVYYTYLDKPDKKGAEIFETEILYQATQALRNIKNIIEEFGLEVQPETLKKLLYKYFHQVQVNFAGEPIAGLQIMGLLESRNIDFDHVFILNANEGKLPAPVSSGSYIPYHLRFAFDLPTFKNNDSMFAYYIYRLLHRSKKVFFIYNHVSDEKTRAEPSRFITQLITESPFKIVHWQQTSDFYTPVIKPIVIKKDEAIVQKLKIYYEEVENPTYLTPSALNTYMDCSLKFYFRYIEGIKEPEDLTEEIDAGTFGNLLHNTMQFIYENYQLISGKNIIEEKDMPLLFSMTDGAIRQALKKEFSKNEEEVELVGDYYILYHILEKYTTNILQVDKQDMPMPVPVMEEKHVFDFDTYIGDKKIKLRLGGRIDRIDIRENHIRVVDYKTGKNDYKNIFSEVHDLFDSTTPQRKDYIFQVFLYTYLLEKFTYGGRTLTPSLLFIRDSYSSGFDGSIRYKTSSAESTPVKDIASFTPEFEAELHALLGHFFDPQVPYTQTTHEKKCGYCPYATICQRT